MEGETWYDLLGVAEDASTGEIKRSWRTIAKQCHPDYHPDDSVRLALFKRAKHAYEVLSDPASRQDYDQSLAASRVPKCVGCGSGAIPGQRFCYFCAAAFVREREREEARKAEVLRQAEAARKRAAEAMRRRAEEAKCAQEARAKAKEKARTARIRAKQKAEEAARPREYDWRADPDELMDRTPFDYDYGSSSDSLNADDLFSVILSEAAIRSAAGAARRAGVKSVTVNVKTEGGSVEVTVNKDMAKLSREVGSTLRAASKMAESVSKWWKGD